MKKLVSLVFLGLFLSGNIYAVNIEWVTIENPGSTNPDDIHGAGYGSVSYDYRISTYEVTNTQYIEFLNAVAISSDPYGLYNSQMSSTYGGITRDVNLGNYTYRLKNDDSNWANRPVVFVSWYDTIRFVNWFYNGQPIGTQNSTTTEDGVYHLTGMNSVDHTYYGGVLRNPDATFWLPSVDEWYKAAYYDPEKGYWNYATQLGTDPSTEIQPVAGVNANYNSYYTSYYSTPVGTYDNSSYYGTYDQAGNVFEWSEELQSQYYGFLRGGAWNRSLDFLQASYRTGSTMTNEESNIGFRLAGAIEEPPIPEPTSLLLLGLGLVGLIRKLRK